MSATVRVDLGARSYDVLIEEGLLARAGDLVRPLLNRSKVFVISESRVAGLHLDTLRDGLAAGGVEMDALVLEPGEATKSWEHLRETVEWLLEQNAERGDVVIAFGGGVIGDLAGFAAAIVRRGVRFVQIPSTLLAQVDSSVGGKTGINSPRGKNLIGAFHQPSLVLADIDLLDTLEGRDFLSGYGEVVKYGLLGDAAFFAWLEQHGPALASGDKQLRAEAVRRAVAMKAAIVARDETEQAERALLNLGHTFSHALETATGYGNRLLHGEGVAIGCALAFEASARLGLCAQEEPSRVRAHLKQMGMRTDIAEIPGKMPDADGLMHLMRQDKKVQAGKMRYVLAHAIGRAFVTDRVDEKIIRAVLRDALM